MAASDPSNPAGALPAAAEAGPAAPAAPRFLVVAQVLRGHGTEGELKCRVVTDYPDRFRPRLTLYAGEPPVAYRVRSVRFQGPDLLLGLTGVTTLEQARALTGAELTVRVEDAVTLPEGRFYWYQVIGLQVETSEGEVLGEVAEILSTGANDVYVVRGGERGEILIPVISEVVQAIEPESGRVTVHLLPGLLPDPPKPRVKFRHPRRIRRTERSPDAPPLAEPTT
ncbi:MAG: 16S rRNA processing protein RimM [Chloroflexi bacterium]|nr:16S rRNA processing protein RimM [Chloroflexota bacterium]